MKDNDALEALFAAERRTKAPAGAANRGWARLSEGLDRGDEPLALPQNVIKVSFAKWAAVALVAAAFGGVLFLSTAREKYELPTAARARDGVSVPEAPGASSPAEVIPEKTTFEAPPHQVPRAARPAPSARATAATSEAAQPSPASVPTFDDELRLLKLAKSQLDSGKAHLAEVTLDEHARRFPNGTFGDERDALQILMLCEAGERKRGAERAQEFARQHAGSPVAERLLRACHVQPAVPPRIEK